MKVVELHEINLLDIGNTIQLVLSGLEMGGSY